MAIDFFLESLAISEKHRAIGIVLSGNGSDGTIGLRAINDHGGATFAQDPKSAKYPDMPQSAIDAGIAHHILRPEEMIKKLVEIVSDPNWLPPISQNIKLLEKDQDDGEPEALNPNMAMETIFSLLRTHTKVDFTNYKQTTIARRIERRMVVHRSKSLIEYAKYLQDNSEEVLALYNDILINVTDFFRDPEAFSALTELVFPALVEERPSGLPIRIWVPGCSTGEEVYSIAICLIEFLESSGKQYPIQIFATDISERVIQKARAGQYPESISQNISDERLRRFFHKVDDGYKIHKMIRDICLFSKHDVTSDPPFAKLDFISCRNVLIYFSAALQKQVIPIFHYALHSGAFLLLGKSENPGEFSKFFNLVEKTNKIYSKSASPKQTTFNFPAKKLPELPEIIKKEPLLTKMGSDFQRDGDKYILSRFAPPSVVVNNDLEILHFRGRTAPFLEPANGHASLNLLKMARPELFSSLRSIIQAVKKENKPIEKRGLQFEFNGKNIELDLEAAPTNAYVSAKERTFLILFKEVAKSKNTGSTKRIKANKVAIKKGKIQNDKRVLELVKELSEIKDYQHALIEQYETTQAELTSANEELQSTNEEFLSTNEEIETAKEELQSTNEELITVNDELQVRNADLTTLSNDLNNLLSSVEIPVLIIGGDHRIRRFSPKAKTAFNLIPTDIGRPISDIKPNFNLNLNDLVSEVTENLSPKEIEIQDFKSAWLRVQVRPYRTLDNKIDGAIIALIDIDLLKQKEIKIKETLEYAENANRAKDVFLATLSHELRTPLSSILTWAQLIGTGKVDFEKAKEGAAVIERSAKTQSQLIDDLLDISRIIAGKLALDFRPVDPSHTIRAAVESVRPMAEKKSIQIEIDICIEAKLILADPVRLQQIIWNLLINAIKFSHNESKVIVQLKYFEKDNKEFAEIKVIDNGKGIPADFLPTIFNRFSQADSSSTRLHGGLGLGLSIVHNLVELQQGTIKAENASEGYGATLTLNFPVLSVNDSVRLQKDFETQNPSGLSYDAKSDLRLDDMKILYVEDDEYTRDAIGIYLKSFGAKVETAESASEALKKFTIFKPDILLSDIAMPVEDGYSLLKKIRSLSPDQGGNVPAIALTAYATADDSRRALAVGFQAHISKPVQAIELCRVILKVSQQKIIQVKP